MRIKQFLKDFWKENKKEYMWACIILTLAIILLYDVMFLSMTHQQHIQAVNYFIWMPISYGSMGLLALSAGLFMFGGDYK